MENEFQGAAVGLEMDAAVELSTALRIALALWYVLSAEKRDMYGESTKEITSGRLQYVVTRILPKKLLK